MSDLPGLAHIWDRLPLMEMPLRDTESCDQVSSAGIYFIFVIHDTTHIMVALK